MHGMGGLAIVAAIAVAYAVVAARLERASITAPIVFLAAGALLGPDLLDQLPEGDLGEVGLVVAELTLGLLLFADASTVRLREVEGDTSLPSRLLFVGLPACMVLGTVAGVALFPDAGWGMAALIATILAPTDAALGLGIFTDRSVPARIRRALNVESGLNDGLATPFVTLCIAFVAAEEGVGASDWIAASVADVAIALLVAGGVGGLGGLALRSAADRGWTSDVSRQLASFALALLSYSVAVTAGGNGFVAAFAGGLVFGATAGTSLARSAEFTERVGLFSSYLVWVVFGAVAVGPVVAMSTALAPLYAALSLTVVRIASVWLATRRTGLDRSTTLFLGWFGPRGLASVVFTLIAIQDLALDTRTSLLVGTATWTILLSVVAHGLTAKPLAARYAAHVARLPVGNPETAFADEPSVRRSLRDSGAALESAAPGRRPVLEE